MGAEIKSNTETPKNEVLFVRINLLYVELSPFQIQIFMVQLSQIHVLNIRHLEI